MKGMVREIIALAIGLITGVICLVIVDDVITAQGGGWNSTLSSTIIQYVVPVGLLGMLALAAGFAYLLFTGRK